MPDIQWKFTNEANPAECIVIHDRESALALERVLQLQGHGQWIMKEEAAPAKPALVSAPEPETEMEPETESETETETEPTAAGTEVSLELEYAPAAAAVAPPPMDPTLAQPVPKARKQPSDETQAYVPDLNPRYEERRKHTRFNTEFRVILISGSSSFRSSSKDISLGGMKLKEKIPSAFLGGKCVAYISHKDMRENIEVLCDVIGEPQSLFRIRFREVEPSRLARLKEWIAERNPNANVA